MKKGNRLFILIVLILISCVPNPIQGATPMPTSVNRVVLPSGIKPGAGTIRNPWFETIISITKSGDEVYVAYVKDELDKGLVAVDTWKKSGDGYTYVETEEIGHPDDIEYRGTVYYPWPRYIISIDRDGDEYIMTYVNKASEVKMVVWKDGSFHPIITIPSQQ